MDREALAELERRVATMRVLTAEKAVLARSLSHGEPPRFHAEISTAILAVAVLVAFLAGRSAGIFAVRGTPCATIAPDQYAVIFYDAQGHEVILDTKGGYWRDGRWKHRVNASAVRAIAEELTHGCFLEAPPPSTPRVDEATYTIALRARGRFMRQHYVHGEPAPLCVGQTSDMRFVEKDVLALAAQD